jgi:hypothetical protein
MVLLNGVPLALVQGAAGLLPDDIELRSDSPAPRIVPLPPFVTAP